MAYVVSPPGNVPLPAECGDSRLAAPGNSDPAPAQGTRYEAIYLIGCEPDTKKFQLHLFDTFGPAYARTVGFGTRGGNTQPDVGDASGRVW